MNKYVLRHSLILLLTAFIWGTAFVAQSAGMDYVGTFTFTACRNVLGALVLIPVILVIRAGEMKKPGADINDPLIRVFNRPTVVGGVLCGIILCIAGNLQQYALKTASTGKAGFITALYILMVPIIGIFLKKKAGIKIWISVAISLVGLYLLCLTDTTGLKTEDYLLFGCAFVFSLHIITVDHFSPDANCVAMSAIQFAVCAVLSAIAMFIFEEPSWTGITDCAVPILYAGVLSSGVAYTLQIVGQKGMNPTIASLIMSLESVFSALAGLVVLHQVLSGRETLGCVLMFAAIILAQLPDRLTFGKKDS